MNMKKIGPRGGAYPWGPLGLSMHTIRKIERCAMIPLGKGETRPSSPPHRPGKKYDIER